MVCISVDYFKSERLWMKFNVQMSVKPVCDVIERMLAMFWFAKKLLRHFPAALERQ